MVRHFPLLIFALSISPALAVDFNRDVRPILSDTCFKCHGPGENKGDLRLDLREDALDAGVLSPGDVQKSELIARLKSKDPDEVMPPPEAHKPLSARQIQILEDWIAQGAPYDQHWSFKAPQKGFVHASIDGFINDRLVKVGLTPLKQADRRTLIRRASFDLTGLPPTPEEIDDFLRDESAQAWEKVIDRLLASDHYGERMALAWMDAARYGDTSVMHADGARDMWPWRDWVIAAYNSNMPFDQFTIEQIAGDLLPQATVSQKVASGFNRNHATSDEGGAFAEELRVEYVADRVQTTSNVWMGLTLECCQCHDHKYDPISQEEYYKFFAYFNNTTDPGMQTRNGNQAPFVEVVDPVREEQLKKLALEEKGIKTEIHDYRLGVRKSSAFAQWVNQEKTKILQQKPEPSPLGLAHWFGLSKGEELREQVTGSPLTLEKGKFLQSKRGESNALKLNGATQFKFEQEVALEFNQPFTFAAWIKPSGKAQGAIFSKMDDQSSYRGIDFWVENGRVGSHLIHSWSDNAIKVVTTQELIPDEWQHVVLTYDGGAKASGIKIYLNGKLTEVGVQADTLTQTIKTPQPFRIGGRSTGSLIKGEIDDLRIYDHAFTVEEVLSVAGSDPIKAILAKDSHERTEREWSTLIDSYLVGHDKGYQNLADKLQKNLKESKALEKKPVTSMVMQDLSADKMRMTYILDRGAYDSPKKEKIISPGVPSALPSLAQDSPPNRLGLARWLTRADHPLTARVAVNRYWMLLFGEGLVRSVGDFGAQGALPSHPELLDWLAVEFISSGWDVKAMIKRIVLSETYKRSSRIDPMHLQKDATNQFLARAPRFRLQGEFVRDQALAVGGLLVKDIGGPGVKPYQPANIWNEVSLNGGLRYPQDKGEKLYRRSMYTYWKRSAPMPNMLIFDAPSREKCVIQRQRTNTPLQALVTLNDPQFLEAARHFARRLLRDPSTRAEDRISQAMILATGRPAQENEIDILKGLYEAQQKRFMKSPEEAKKFLSVGESPRDETLDLIEHASWTVVAQTILNLDETLTRN